jgi:phosphoglycolate phosphatase-like HAD superfamily hydrolase
VLVEASLPAITRAQYLLGTRYPTPERLAWHATGDVDDASGPVLGAAFDRHYVRLVSASTAGFYPGIGEIVDAIAAHPVGKAQAVLSNACGAYARAVLETNGRLAAMAHVHGADDAPRPKPHPDGLLAQCDASGWDPARCVYVGDSPSDGIAARAAGMMSVGVAWGAHDGDALAAEGRFDAVALDARELRRLLLGEE